MATYDKIDCETVRTELAVPGSSPAASDLSAHLEICPSCAHFAAGLDRLDRAWDLTRPVEPSPLVFDALWERALAGADAPVPAGARRRASETFTVPMSSGRRRFGWSPRVLAVPSAAAAVLLVAILGSFRQNAETPQVALTTRALPVVNVEVDQTVVVRVDGSGAGKVTELEAPGSNPEAWPISPVVELAVGNDHDALGAFESLASDDTL